MRHGSGVSIRWVEGGRRAPAGVSGGRRGPRPPRPRRGGARRLLRLAEQAPRGASLRYTLGDVLTLWRAAADPLSRERAMKLGEMTVVDAGGYVVAEAGRDKGVPFLAVRV